MGKAIQAGKHQTRALFTFGLRTLDSVVVLPVVIVPHVDAQRGESRDETAFDAEL